MTLEECMVSLLREVRARFILRRIFYRDVVPFITL